MSRGDGPGAEPPPLSILYRDEQLLIVNKPSGLLVHRGWARDAVVAMTLARDAIGRWVYPVHRLDRGTSGALIFALDPASAASMQALFEAGEVEKRYLALVRGIPPEHVMIDHPLASRSGGPRVAAVTEVHRLAVFERYALIEAMPKTGRLHQIRRHLKHLSHPLIGDVRYGKGEHNRLFRQRFGLHRLALHAVSVSFPHPVDGRRVSVEAEIPEDLAGPWRAMGFLSRCARKASLDSGPRARYDRALDRPFVFDGIEEISMSEAQAINRQLEADHPALFRALSPLGRRAFFPPGIPVQAAEAKNTRYNGTIGLFTDGRGQAVPLPSLARTLDLSPEDLNRAMLYSPVAGIAELRDAWRRWQRREQGDESPSSLPLVTNGLSHGLSIAADLFTCEEHPVLIPEPYWGNYRQVFSLRTGTEIRTAPIFRDGRYNPLAISEAATGLPPGKPVVAIINFPSNPGGYSPTPEERDELRRSLLTLADERPVVVLCDDAYAGFVYEDGIPRASMFWELAGIHEQLIAVKIDGATKELSFFGGRVGFLTFGLDTDSPAFEVMQNKVMSLVRSTVGSPVAVSQMILLQALRDEKLGEDMAHIFAIAEGRYRAVSAAVKELDAELLTPLPFNSGFFVMLQLAESLELDVQVVRHHLIHEHDTGIIATPPCYLRIATCSVAAEDLPEMVTRLARGVEELAAKAHR